MPPSAPTKPDRTARPSGPFGAALLVLLCAAVYLPGLVSIPAIDRDESRFAQASRQMFESVTLPAAELDDAMHSGGLVIPRVQGRDRLNKPPLVYWLQAGSAAAFTLGDPSRDAIWMYRLPSVLCATTSVIILWRLGRSMLNPRAGWLAAALLAVSPMVVWDAHQARADQLLLACTTGAMFFLWRIYAGNQSSLPGATASCRPSVAWVHAGLLWFCIALGILAKGPITPMVVVLTALTICILTRNWRWLWRTKPAVGLILTAAIVAPWIIAVASRVGWGEYLALILDETLGRSATAKESHWGPPGYHLVLSPVLLWPGSLLTALAFVCTARAAIRLPDRTEPGLGAFLRLLPARWRGRAQGGTFEVFCLCWIVPSWIVFEFVSTKLPHYVLPLYPAICLISAKLACELTTAGLSSDLARKLRPGLAIWVGIGAVLGAGVPVTLAFLSGAGLGAQIVAVASGVLVLAILWGACSTWNTSPFRAHILGLSASILFVATLLGVILPRADRFFITPKIIDRAGWSPGTPIASISYHEDSLVFETRGGLARIDAHQAESWLASNPGGILIAPSSLPVRTSAVTETLSGFNYAAGDEVELNIIEPTP